MLTSLLLNQKTSLRGILSSVDCYLTRREYGKRLFIDPEFMRLRDTLKAKQKELKKTRRSLDSKRNFVSPHSHVICSVHCMACTFFGGGGGEAVIFVVSFHCT